MIGSSLISLAISVLIIVALWKVYNKAGKPGWAAIISYSPFSDHCGTKISFLLR